MRNRLAALIGTSALVAVGAFGMTAVLPTASAFGAEGAACTTIVHHDLSGVKIDNDADGTTTSATTELLDRGVKVTTPDNGAQAHVSFPTVFALSDVTTMSFGTYRYATSPDTASVPTYEIDVLLSGHANTSADPLPDGWTGPWSTTLVYTPDPGTVSNGTWQTWDADADGAAKWSSTTPLAAIPGDAGASTPETWSSILAAYPNAVGSDYSIQQPPQSNGAVTAFDDVTFGTSAGCTTQNWAADVPATADPSPAFVPPTIATRMIAPNASATPVSHSTTSASQPTLGTVNPLVVTAPTPSPSTAASARANADVSTGGLALTGPDFIVPAGFGLTLVVAGAILYGIARRRRQSLY